MDGSGSTGFSRASKRWRKGHFGRIHFLLNSQRNVAKKRQQQTHHLFLLLLAFPKALSAIIQQYLCLHPITFSSSPNMILTLMLATDLLRAGAGLDLQTALPAALQHCHEQSAHPRAAAVAAPEARPPLCSHSHCCKSTPLGTKWKPCPWIFLEANPGSFKVGRKLCGLA